MAQSRLSVMGFLAIAFIACKSHEPKTYNSECAAGISYKKVTFAHLIDSAKTYNGLYVEVSGKYLEGKNLSALVNDSTLTTDNNLSLWVNFTQDCPLYLQGKHTGLFEAEDGEYNKLNDKLLTIRGRI